ncbi:conserved oligomeric Golgi complex subunit 8-like protein, partial [Leptotrombidium deliense]
KLEAFTETQLRIKFLTARDAWLQCLIKEIPTTNSLVYISKLTELYRVNLFDIITQYRAVFAGDDTTTPSIRLYIQVEDVNMKESSILPSWIHYKIESYLKQLETHLNELIANDYNYYPIDAIIDPCFYFGLSMSRIGSDFRPLLLPIFINSFKQI